MGLHATVFVFVLSWDSIAIPAGLQWDYNFRIRFAWDSMEVAW